MGDSETDRRADTSHAELMAEFSSLRDLLAERDNQLSTLVDQLRERDERLADLTDLIRDLRDEIRLLKKLPRHPDLKPSGLAVSPAGWWLAIVERARRFSSPPSTGTTLTALRSSRPQASDRSG